jgi:hypothetical protein
LLEDVLKDGPAGNWYFTRVSSSAMSMVKPPSPDRHTTCRSRKFLIKSKDRLWQEQRVE